MKTTHYEKKLRSLVREQNRIWRIYLRSFGNVKIEMSNKKEKTFFRETEQFPHCIIEVYMAYLQKRIDYYLALIQEIKHENDDY